MFVPALGSRSLRLAHLANTFAGCTTLQSLFGAGDETEALERIYSNISEDDGTEPRPRLVIRHMNSADAERWGTDSVHARGVMLGFLQFDTPSDASLVTQYSLGSVTLKEQDRRRDLDNIMGQITDQICSRLTTPGCLELRKVEEFSAGLVDPAEENGEQFYELVWMLHYMGAL